METDLLLHPITKKQLAAYFNQPAGTLLLAGQVGAGKSAVVRELSASLLSTKPDKLDNHPYFIWIEKQAGKSEIPIDDVRTVIKKMALKASASGDINRVVVISEAENLSTEAQNALLKLLEEPGKDTAFILTSATPDKILPTIISRTQSIKVLPPSLDDSLSYFNSPQADVESAWRLSRGATGLLSALLDNSQQHPLKQAVDEAKIFLKHDNYKRLVLLQEISKDKQHFMVFMEALSRVLSALQTDAAQKNNTTLAKRILTTRKALDKQHKHMLGNVNQRLINQALCLDVTL